MGTQAQHLFGTMEKSGRNFVVILPNNDPGSQAIVDVIDTLPRDRFRVLPSMRFSHFSELMKNAACIVGNSSAGVREAPFLGIPSLDVGTRQNARSQSASITSVAAHETDRIAEFLQSEWGKKYPLDAEFGQGSAAARFVDTLNQPEFWSQSFQKVFQDNAG